MQLYLPPWNMASYHLESIPNISLNMFYFPKYNSECTDLSQTAPQFNPISNPKEAPNSSPKFAILVPSNAPLKTSQFYRHPHPKVNPLGSRTKFFLQNSNPPLVLAPLRNLRPLFFFLFSLL